MRQKGNPATPKRRDIVSDIMADFLDRASTLGLFPVANSVSDNEAERLMQLSDGDFIIEVNNLPQI